MEHELELDVMDEFEEGEDQSEDSEGWELAFIKGTEDANDEMIAAWNEDADF